jgi:deazaflavin-dependent oxidoreductase (nitroreductase family)
VPLPRAAARFNRVVTNRVFGPLGGHVPPWALVEHVGRRSGRTYRTVIWAFPRRGDLAMALTYGPQSDWVRNVLAAGTCRVQFLGRWETYAPELLHGQAGLRLLPPILRTVLDIAGVHDVLHMRRTLD